MTTRQPRHDLQRHWRPPDGLDRSRPREVRLSAGGRALIVLSFALFAAGGVGGALLQARLGHERAELDLLRSEGVVIEARVARLWRGRGEHRPPYVAYRFDAAGTWHEGSRRVPLRLFRQLHEGDALAIRYAPSRPALNHPLAVEPRAMPQVLPIGVALALALLGGVCWLPVVAQRRLLAEGRAAHAVVTGHKQHQHGKVMSYEFATLAGSLARGKTGPQRKPQPIGSTLCVLYDPEQPSRNSSYPLSLVRPFRGELR